MYTRALSLSRQTVFADKQTKTFACPLNASTLQHILFRVRRDSVKVRHRPGWSSRTLLASLCVISAAASWSQLALRLGGPDKGRGWGAGRGLVCIRHFICFGGCESGLNGPRYGCLPPSVRRNSCVRRDAPGLRPTETFGFHFSWFIVNCWKPGTETHACDEQDYFQQPYPRSHLFCYIGNRKKTYFWYPEHNVHPFWSWYNWMK